MINTIPIKPHLKKFVIWMLGVQEPVKVSERDMLGRCIIKVLQEKRTQRNVRGQNEGASARIRVKLTQDMAKRSPYLHRLININVELDNEFHDAIILWVKSWREMGMPASTACKEFLRVLKIDENEYTYDAAYKVWQRDGRTVREKESVQEPS